MAPMTKKDFGDILDDISLVTDLADNVANSKKLLKAMGNMDDFLFTSTVKVAGKTMTVVSALSAFIEIGNLSEELRKNPQKKNEIINKQFGIAIEFAAPFLAAAAFGGPAGMFVSIGTSVLKALYDINEAKRVEAYEKKIKEEYAKIKGITAFRNTRYNDMGFKYYRNYVYSPKQWIMPKGAKVSRDLNFPGEKWCANLVELITKLRDFEKINSARVSRATNQIKWTYIILSSGYISITGIHGINGNAKLGIKGITLPDPLIIPEVLDKQLGLVKNGTKVVSEGFDVQEIGEGAFKNYKGIKRVQIQGTKKFIFIRASAFEGSSITEINIPASVIGIEKRAFADCKSLTKVTVLASLNLKVEGDSFKNTRLDETSRASIARALARRDKFFENLMATSRNLYPSPLAAATAQKTAAQKTTAQKAATQKTAAQKAAAQKAAAQKAAAQKAAAQKAAAQKAAAQKAAAQRAAAQKAAAQRAAAQKAAAQRAAAQRAVPKKPVAKTTAKPVPKKPVAKPTKKPVPKKPIAKTTAKPVPKKPVAKPTTKPVPKKPVAKITAKPVPKKPVAKTAAKPVPKKPVAKTTAKPVPKKPVAKTTAKPVPKKPVAKTTVKPVPKKPVATTAATPPVLKRGMKGEAVRKLQSELNRVFPSYSKLAVDGSFGPATEAVIKQFQKRSGITIGGTVGPNTRAKLIKAGVRF